MAKPELGICGRAMLGIGMLTWWFGLVVWEAKIINWMCRVGAGASDRQLPCPKVASTCTSVEGFIYHTMQPDSIHFMAERLAAMPGKAELVPVSWRVDAEQRLAMCPAHTLQAKEIERLNQVYKNIMKNAGVELIGESPPHPP